MNMAFSEYTTVFLFFSSRLFEMLFYNHTHTHTHIHDLNDFVSCLIPSINLKNQFNSFLFGVNFSKISFRVGRAKGLFIIIFSLYFHYIYYYIFIIFSLYLLLYFHWLRFEMDGPWRGEMRATKHLILRDILSSVFTYSRFLYPICCLKY